MSAARPRTSRAALLAELAAEIRHHYGHGRRLVGVDGPEHSAAPERLADDLAVALRAEGTTVECLHLDSPADFGAERLAAFRAGTEDALLVVDGPFLGDRLADAFAWTAWLDTDGPGIGSGGLRTSAHAIIDVTDPEHPVRRLSDWCVVPRRR